MKVLRFSYFLVTILLLSGCTSYFKRKQCESTNWFEHARGRASSARSDVYSTKNQVDNLISSKSLNEARISEYTSELTGLD